LEKSNFSIWDILVHMLTGVSFIIFLTFLFPHEVSVFLERNKNELNSLSTALTLFMPFLLVWIGMIIEPVANKTFKKLEKIEIFSYQEGRSTAIAKNKAAEKANIEPKLLFRYCKSVVEQNIPTNSIQIYLARFGFYRNTSFLTLMAAATILFSEYTITEKIIYSVLLAALSYIFFERANRFKQHQEYEVYFTYLAYKMNKEGEKNA